MSIEKGPKQLPQETDDNPESNIIDFAEAKKRIKEKNRAKNLEQGEPDPEFENGKKEFLERTRELLNTLHERTVKQNAEMEKRQTALDQILINTGNGEHTAPETLYADCVEKTNSNFAEMRKKLELAEQVNDPELFDEIKQSFEESLGIIEQSLDEQERVALGRVPQKELDAMPEIVRRTVLYQQQNPETGPNDLLERLNKFRQRLDLIKNFIGPDLTEKIETAISHTEAAAPGLEFAPTLKQMELKSAIETTITKIDGAIRTGEERSGRRR